MNKVTISLIAGIIILVMSPIISAGTIEIGSDGSIRSQALIQEPVTFTVSDITYDTELKDHWSYVTEAYNNEGVVIIIETTDLSKMTRLFEQSTQDTVILGALYENGRISAIKDSRVVGEISYSFNPFLIFWVIGMVSMGTAMFFLSSFRKTKKGIHPRGLTFSLLLVSSFTSTLGAAISANLLSDTVSLGVILLIVAVLFVGILMLGVLEKNTKYKKEEMTLSEISPYYVICFIYAGSMIVSAFSFYGFL